MEDGGQAMSQLSGYVCVRNGISLDYCWELAIESMIPVCDEVVISVGLKEGEKDDGTFDRAMEWEKKDSRTRVVVYPWNDPHRHIGWWVEWLNWTRQELRYPMQFSLDADEVLDPRGYDKMRQICIKSERAFFRRQNYWSDPQHLIPHNRGCGYLVARLGPTALYMPSDEPEPANEHNIRRGAKEHPELIIHHLGFLRKPEAFLAKSEVVQKAFFGVLDGRLEKHVQDKTDWRQSDYFYGEELQKATEPIPDIIKGWLLERGYKA